MEEKLNEKVEEFSLERLKRAAGELNKTEESRKENLEENSEGPRPLSPSSRPFLKTKQDEVNLVTSIEGGAYGAGGKIPSPIVQKGEMKIAGAALSDLIQERMKLEKILQEMNKLKSKICQRIELIKTIERREKELNQQLASARKEDDFPNQIKKSFENLKGDIK